MIDYEARAFERAVALYDKGGMANYEAMLRGEPARDLDALGIDSPHDRWLATVNYLRDLAHERKMKRFVVLARATVFDFAEENAARRGAVLADGEPLLEVTDFRNAKAKFLEGLIGIERDWWAAAVDPVLPEAVRDGIPSDNYKRAARTIQEWFPR